ncbi:hypothetical protein RHS04_02226 [Rhizoctonia solani]|uniref:Uncharacterized protein n=1 Tax=Rhizoctonia solani TaxID=456999 RepID=A0A8H7HCC6_9AGAM|nr:hypothetical protein RHS04_02226 [Rhizoctonia solani]
MVPTPLSSEPIPKGMARILGAERVRADYRAQQKKKREEEDRDRKGRDTIELLPGESLREFNRRVEDAHRPLVRGALKRKNEEKRREKKKKETKKRKRDESDDEGEDAKGVEQRPVREFATVSSSAPRRLNEVAQAPPVLTKGPKGSGVGKDGGKAPAVSMARKVILERKKLQSWAMASSTAGATISLPSFASSFEMTQQRTSPRARSAHSSRSNSREPRPRHFRPYPESNTRGAPRDERSRKRPAPIDEADGDGDVGMQSDREQDGDDESSGSSSGPVKQEQVSDVEQSPSPPPTPAGGRSVRYAHALPQPIASAQTQFAPTPPASAHRVSPPHIALPTLPQHQRDAHLTLPPMLHPPPEPQQTYHTYHNTHSEPLARKRRRVTISGVAAGSQAAPRPLHRTVLERANNGFQSHNPPSASTATPATPTAMSGMVSPVVTPGFNMNLPGALAQVRDTIAIRMEQKALIEQRKNGGAANVTVTTPHTRTAPQPPPPLARTQSSPAAQSSALPPPTTNSPLQNTNTNTITPPSLPTASTPTTLTGPPPQTQTLAHRRGKASSKLTIHTPNSSISSTQGAPGNATGGLGLSGAGSNPPLGPPGPTSRLAVPNIEVAIRSAPPNVTRFNPAQIQRPHPAQPPPPPALRTAQPPPKERSVPIRRMHANSTAAPGVPPGPLAVVAAGQPLVLNAPAPPSSYIPTPTRTQFPPHTPHPQPPRTARPPTSPPISRNAFMAFYDAYAEVHALRAQVERMERETERRVELAVHEMKEEIRMLREEIRRGHDREPGYPPYHREREPGYARDRVPDYAREREIYGRERTDSTFTRERGDSTYTRDWDRRRGGSASVNQSPMQLDKRPLPGHPDKMQLDKPIERPALPGPGDRLPPPPGERIPGPGERLGPGDRIVGPGERIPPPPPPPAPGTSNDKLHKPAPRSALRKSPSGRNLQSSLSPTSRAPSIGATPGPGGNGAGPGGETGVQTRAQQQRVRTKSPGGGDKSGSG